MMAVEGPGHPEVCWHRGTEIIIMTPAVMSPMALMMFRTRMSRMTEEVSYLTTLEVTLWIAAEPAAETPPATEDTAEEVAFMTRDDVGPEGGALIPLLQRGEEEARICGSTSASLPPSGYLSKVTSHPPASLT